MQSTGLLAADAVEHAFATLRRYRALCKMMGVKKVLAIATAACRDARNGRAFVKLAERTIGTDIDVLSGGREAELTALGVISGVHRADGVVGDLGGGSLELVDVRGTRVRHGITRPLGGLALADISAKSVKKAEKLVKKTLSALPMLKACEDRSFYAVGGTWRSLARLHMWQTGYPLHVMHGYAIHADEALEFARLLHRVDVETLSNIDVVANARRPLLPYAALVLEYILRARQAAAGGVLRARRTRRAAVLAADAEGQRKGRIDRAGARTQSAAFTLVASRRGADRVDRSLHVLVRSGRNRGRRRLRHAACLLADIGWRAHPDYRGEQSLDIIAHGGFAGVDHPGRAYLALAVFYRHVGLVIDDELSLRLRRARLDTHDRPRPGARRRDAACLCGHCGNARRAAACIARG